jgi:hypothetical protein
MCANTHKQERFLNPSGMHEIGEVAWERDQGVVGMARPRRCGAERRLPKHSMGFLRSGTATAPRVTQCGRGWPSGQGSSVNVLVLHC